MYHKIQMSASKEGYRYGNLFDAHTQTTYPRVGHDMLITMVCFPTHADIMLEVYKQKTCIRFSILHAPSTASALVAHGRGGVWPPYVKCK